MFMEIIPAWKVEVRVNKVLHTFRVPQDQLESFIHVMLFNNAEMINMEMSDGPS